MNRKPKSGGKHAQHSVAAQRGRAVGRRLRKARRAAGHGAKAVAVFAAGIWASVATFAQAVKDAA